MREDELRVLVGRAVAVHRALVHRERRRLPVVLAAVRADVRLRVRVHHVVLVEARVLGEPLAAAVHRAHVRLLACNTRARHDNQSKLPIQNLTS